MSSFQEFEVVQNQLDKSDFNEEERDLEEALSLSDLPITTFSSEEGDNEGRLEEKPLNDEENNDFDFGLLVGQINTLEGEMCVADDVFSGGQILPYHNSVSSMFELQNFSSRSESMDRRVFGSRSSSSRSSSIRSHYSGTSCSSSSSIVSVKTVPMVSKSKVRNQFHSCPSPKPQVLNSGVGVTTHVSPMGKKSKMWEVLKLGLVRTPKIELQNLKIHQHGTNNFGKSYKFPRNHTSNSSSSNNNYCNNNKIENNNNCDRARKSSSNEGNKISNFMMEMQRKKSEQLSKNKNDGFFKSCKSSIKAIDPLLNKPNYYSEKSMYLGISPNNKQGKSQHNLSRKQVSNEDKNLEQKKLEKQEEEKRNIKIQQEKKEIMSHHHSRTFEWLKNISHSSVLNS